MAQSTKKDLEENVEAMLGEMTDLKEELTDSLKNKSAASRARKLTLSISKLGKEFRTLSVAFSKE